MLSRPATPADAPLLTELYCRYDVAFRGAPDTDESDVVADWQQPGFDLAADTLVVEDDGRPVGYAVVLVPGECDSVADPRLPDERVAAQLLDWLEQRSGRLDHYVPDTDPALGRMFADHGWEPARRFWRMRVELPADRDELPAPQWPSGVEVRDFDRDSDPVPVHTLITSGFREIGGQHERTLDQWTSWMLHTPKYDAGLYLVAVRDGEVVGASLSQDLGDYGLVRQLAVTPAARRQGLALALLHESFRRHAARGLPATALGVDAANPTGALVLYEQAGMRVSEQFTRWERPAR